MIAQAIAASSSFASAWSSVASAWPRCDWRTPATAVLVAGQLPSAFSAAISSHSSPTVPTLPAATVAARWLNRAERSVA